MIEGTIPSRSVILKNTFNGGGGDITVWDPTAGKKFRLLGFTVTIGSNCTLAAAGAFTLRLKDSATDLFIWTVNINNAALNQAPYLSVTVNLPENGYLSAAADNNLVINESAAFASGGVGITAWGVEESP